jgi:hypothetical protein
MTALPHSFPASRRNLVNNAGWEIKIEGSMLRVRKSPHDSSEIR